MSIGIYICIYSVIKRCHHLCATLPNSNAVTLHIIGVNCENISISKGDMDLFVLQPDSMCILHIGPKALNQSDMPL